MIAAMPQHGDRTPRTDDRQLLLKSSRRASSPRALGGRLRRARQLRTRAQRRARRIARDDRSFLRRTSARAGRGEASPPAVSCVLLDASDERFSYDEAVAAGARALAAGATTRARFVDVEATHDATDEATVVTLDELVAFWREPSRWFVRNVLRMSTHFEDVDLDRPALDFDSRTAYRLAKEAIERDSRPTTSRPSPIVPSTPPGGRAERRVDWPRASSSKRCSANGATAAPDGDGAVLREAEVATPTWILRGRLSVHPDHGMLDFVGNSSVKPKALIGPWIRHVLLGAIGAGDAPWLTRVKPTERRAARLVEGAEDPAATLDEIVSGYLQAHRRPVHFFPDTSAAWWKAVGRADPDDPAVRARAWGRAREKWHDELEQKGDQFDESVALCTRGLDDVVDDDFVRGRVSSVPRCAIRRRRPHWRRS